MNHKTDIIIVGGGIVGMAAALGMAQLGYQVALVDAGAMALDAPKMDQRVYAINHASKALLQQLNVWPLMDKSQYCEYRHMHVWDAATNTAIDFDATEIAQATLGTMIEEWVLKNALLQRVLQESAIQIYAHQAVETVESSTQTITVRSKDLQWQAALLMIADGARSPTRDALKVSLTSWPYQHHALVATVKTERPHQKTAWQVFHAEGPLAFLPLPDGHHCSIVWSNSPARTQELMDLSIEDFNTELAKAFSDTLGKVTLESHRTQFPLLMRHVNQYAGDHWLILGDAAHTIHPLAGLGLNLGLADVNSWLNIVKANPDKPFAKRRLSQYQRERKHEVWQVILMMEGLKRIFSFSTPTVSSLRGIGLKWVNQFTPLKRLLIQHATGEGS